MLNQKVELLAPAGTLKNLKFALAYGADAVYAGQPRYSLRVRNNEFDLANLAKGIELTHGLGKKFYVVSNIAAHNSKIPSFIEDVAQVIKLQPDALIMSDPGLISLVMESFPKQEIHLSVQANVVNWASVKFWHKLGIRRIILSRELSLKEIEEIQQKVPEIELEVFVHGALCIAYSGRCLLSGYINKRDANQGTCTNACRWNYNSYKGKLDDTGDLVAANATEINVQDINTTEINATEIVSNSSNQSNLTAITVQSIDTSSLNADSTTDHEQDPQESQDPQEPSDIAVLLEEQGRPGELMPAFEDEHGTYIMNSKDLRAVNLVPNLIDIGVTSLKIEGRTKSHYYVARTAKVYRQAIDNHLAGLPFDNSLMASLEGLANRGYTEGFLQRHKHGEYQNYETGNSNSYTEQFVADVIDLVDDYLELDVKNKFNLGDTLKLITPSKDYEFVVDEILNANAKLSKNDKRQNLTYLGKIESALGSGNIVRIKNIFENATAEELRIGLLVKVLTK